MYKLLLFIAIFSAVKGDDFKTAKTKKQFLFLTTRKTKIVTKPNKENNLKHTKITPCPKANTPKEWAAAYKLMEDFIKKHGVDEMRTYGNNDDALPTLPKPEEVKDNDPVSVYKEWVGAQNDYQRKKVNTVAVASKNPPIFKDNYQRNNRLDKNRFVVKFSKENKDPWKMEDVYLTFDHYLSFYKLEGAALQWMQGIGNKQAGLIGNKQINEMTKMKDMDYPAAYVGYENNLHTLYRLTTGYETALKSYNKHLKALRYNKARLENIGNELNEFYYYEDYAQNYYDD